MVSGKRPFHSFNKNIRFYNNAHFIISRMKKLLNFICYTFDYMKSYKLEAQKPIYIMHVGCLKT